MQQFAKRGYYCTGKRRRLYVKNNDKTLCSIIKSIKTCAEFTNYEAKQEKTHKNIKRVYRFTWNNKDFLRKHKQKRRFVCDAMLIKQLLFLQNYSFFNKITKKWFSA